KPTYIFGIVHLLEHGEEALIRAVEGRRLPLNVAMEIARGNDQELQRALSEAYQNGELRGNKLAHARRIIARRLSKRNREPGEQAQHRLTGASLVREYQHHV